MLSNILGANEIRISLSVLRKDPENFCAKDWRNTMASRELKTEANVSKMYKKLILKNLLLICCNFSFNFNSRKKNPSNKHFLNDYCLVFWQAAPETLALWVVCHRKWLGVHPSLSYFAWEEADGCEFSSRTEHSLALNTGNGSCPSGAFSVTTVE